jgi:hypothetical protein
VFRIIPFLRYIPRVQKSLVDRVPQLAGSKFMKFTYHPALKSVSGPIGQAGFDDGLDDLRSCPDRFDEFPVHARRQMSRACWASGRGPFRFDQMSVHPLIPAFADITHNTVPHYLDITGELHVFLAAQRRRRNGVIEEVPLAHSRRRVDFTGGSAMTVAIAWGDLATAYISTGIPNIETYVSMPPAAVIASALNWARPLLAWATVQKLLRRLADRSTGPSEEELRTGRSRFWSKVSNAAGDHRTARLETANGYRADRRRHDHGGDVPARLCTGRRLLHAKQADGCALRGTVAGVNSHPRGLN